MNFSDHLRINARLHAGFCCRVTPFAAVRYCSRPRFGGGGSGDLGGGGERHVTGSDARRRVHAQNCFRKKGDHFLPGWSEEAPRPALSEGQDWCIFLRKCLSKNKKSCITKGHSQLQTEIEAKKRICYIRKRVEVINKKNKLFIAITSDTKNNNL